MVTKEYPVIPLRGVHAFPHSAISFDAGRPHARAAVDVALEGDKRLFLTAQKDEDEEDSFKAELYDVGTIVRVRQVVRLPDGHMRVLAEGVARGQLLVRTDSEDMLRAEVAPMVILDEETLECEACHRTAMQMYEDFAAGSNRITPELADALDGVSSQTEYGDVLAQHLLKRFDDKQRALEVDTVADQFEVLLELLNRELEMARIERTIAVRVQKQLDHNQKEYVLREQLRAIRNELGEEGENEIDTLRRKAEELPLSTEAKTKVLKEISRLEGMPPSSHEATVSRSWLDWVLDLPWEKSKSQGIDIVRARRILERDHYALDKVKTRVLEYLAVRALAGSSLKGPILCLVGPPGVGKTSIGRSIAEAMGRKFVRMSLGGVRDEAEIRGHRRTYIGAVPGRILAAMRQVGVDNPLFLLDEIDKLSTDAHGDPASALLEVLDAEQNHTFADHYLDASFDLSQVIFVATANTVDSIPRPLLDRMEIIECPGYTDEEKLMIAKRHLLPRQMKQHGLRTKAFKVSAAAIRGILNGYTRESGVRQLERQLGALCRKAALQIAEGAEQIAVSDKNLIEFLEKPKFFRDDTLTHAPGVVTGLAWTAVGGETLQVEVMRLPGSGKLVLTGQMGDVMQESAQTAASMVRHVLQEWNVTHDVVKEDWHVHIPEGAVQKDGPSAGITMASAMLSACTGRSAYPYTAMTGELTLTGRVLPVGGIKEKVLAANRAGVRTVILPQANLRDLSELPPDVRDKLTFVPVAQFEDVINAGLERGPTNA